MLEISKLFFMIIEKEHDDWSVTHLHEESIGMPGKGITFFSFLFLIRYDHLSPSLMSSDIILLIFRYANAYNFLVGNKKYNIQSH